MSTKFLKLSTYIKLLFQSYDVFGIGDAWSRFIIGSPIAVKTATLIADDRRNRWRSCGTAERQALAKRWA